MSIGSVTPVGYPTSASATSWQNGFDQLAQAIQSGNLAAAQQAYAALTQPVQGSATSPNSSQANPLGPIGAALQAGNISAAQQALQALQQSAQGRPHHHHHHGGAAPNTPAQDTTAQNATSSTLPNASAGPSIDLTA
jgi:soluble cytochrome b562